MERTQPSLLQTMKQLLDARFVADRGKRIRSSCRRVGGIGTAVAVDIINALGHRVIRLKFFVPDWPSRRATAVMAEFTEIPFTQTKQRSAENFGRTSNKVVRTRLK